MVDAVRFAGKSLVVTGAAQGIGRAVAAQAVAEGGQVLLVDRSEHVHEAAAEIGAGAKAMTADLEHFAECTRVMAAANRIDVLVNNAGYASFGSFEEMPIDEWRKTMAVDVDGVVFMTRAALPHLLARRGNVVNVSSASGLGGDWGLAFYNAAKGAVTNLTRALAMEYGSKGVRVNAVNPSLTVTEMSAGLMTDAAVMAKFRERIPMGRAAEPAEVADVIAFLASDDARFVTGVNLPVAGGVSASNGQPRLL